MACTRKVISLCALLSIILFLSTRVVIADAEEDKKEAQKELHTDVPLLPPADIAYLESCMLMPSKGSRERIDDILSNVSAGAKSEYGIYDCLLYLCGLHAQIAAERDKAVEYYRKYFERRRNDPAFKSIPSEMYLCKSISRIRKHAAFLQEIIWKKWGKYRFAVHVCKSYHKGYEFHNVTANLALLDAGVYPEMRKSASGLPSEPTNNNVLVDYAGFWHAVNEKKLGRDEKSIIAGLKSSRSYWPVPSELIEYVETPPELLFGLFRPVTLLLVCVIALVFVLVGLLARKKSRDSGISGKTGDGNLQLPAGPLFPLFSLVVVLPVFIAFLFSGRKGGCTAENKPAEVPQRFHENEPFGYFALEVMRGSYLKVLPLFILICGVFLALLAWSEETLFVNSIIVDRPFFSYLSFPFGFGLVIPLFITAGMLFFSYAPKVINASIQTVCNKNEPALTEANKTWSKYHGIMTSKWSVLFITFIASLVTFFQQVQWIHDPGTAFVDVLYLERFSFTGLYWSLIAVIIYYIIFTLLYRMAIVLFFISKLFSGGFQKKYECEPAYVPNHPDKCSSLRNVGILIGLSYVLLFFLAIQVILNFGEKFRFYESFDVVFQSTFLSVLVFAGAYVIILPIFVGLPLLKIHLSLRRFRFRKVLHYSGMMSNFGERANKGITDDTFSSDYADGFSYLDSRRDKFQNMPMWPLDFKLFIGIVSSYMIPVLAVSVPKLLTLFKIAL
jgi:hypothetical protein